MPLQPAAAELEWTPPPRPTPRQSARAVGVVWVLATVLLSFLYLGIWRPRAILNSPREYLDGSPALVMIVSAAFGVALLIGLLWANRRRLKPLLRVTAGKIAAMALLALSIPVDFFGPVPLSMVFVIPALSNPLLTFTDRAVPVFLILSATALSYVAGAAILHGIRNRVLRGLALAAFALAEIAAVALLRGLTYTV